MDSPAARGMLRTLDFVVFPQWNAECVKQLNAAAEISWERMRWVFRLLDQLSSWSPCGDPFPNKPTPHGDP